MRATHDSYDFAAPSPIVPTSRTRQSNKATPFYHMSASTARHISSIANGDTDSKPLRLLGIISDGQQQHPDSSINSPHKAEDVADLIRCLQSPSAATVTSTASATGTAPASATSLLTTTSGSGVRDMLKAGHRRLRQLAQRQRKDMDSASKADEEACQLSALHREGLLPSPVASSAAASSAAASPAASISTLRRSPAKRKSAESSPVHPTHPTPQQNSSRRDVERIGQPWLADPLERCMLDTLSSSGRLSSLDLGDLAAFMDTALDEPESKSESKTESKMQSQSQPQPQPQSQPAQPAQPEPKPQSTQSDSKDSDKTEDKQKEEKEDKTDKEKRPHLKLFPDPLPPPRISNKAARRLSKCPPAQPAGLPPVTEIPSSSKPDREQSAASDREQSTLSDKEPAPSDKEFTLTEKEPTSAEKQSAPAETYQLPIHTIKAMFPLPAPTRPAPTRPLPAVPETAVNLKKNGHSSPSSGSRASQSPILHQPPEPQRQSPPQTSHLQVTANSESERRPRPFSFEAPVVESSDKPKSIDFDHTHNKERPLSPSAVSSPPTLASTRPLNWQAKRPSPSMAPEIQPGSQIRRNNSACGPVHRLEHPLPSSDEEGRQEGMRKQKRTNPSPQKKHHHHRSKLSSAKPAPLSPTRSPPSQHDVHPVDSHSHPFANVHVQTLQGRVAHLERQNKVLQAALLAALDAGNKDPSASASDGFLLSAAASAAASPGPAPAPASTPVSRITPPSSLTTSASSMDEPEHEHGPRDDRRDTWLDLETRSRSSSGSSNSTLSFDFGATERALEGIHDVDFGWLSDRSSFVH